MIIRQYLKKNFDKLSWDNKLIIAYQLACAVSCLHDEGIMHSDLVIVIIGYIIIYIIFHYY